MVDLDYLAKILPLLRLNGVVTLKMDGLEVALRESKELIREQPPHPPISTQAEEPQAPDLKADDSLNFDKILYWSGSPDSQNELPLAGDTPLEAP